MTKQKITSAVSLSYIKLSDDPVKDLKNKRKVRIPKKVIIQVPEEVLPPMTESEKSMSGRSQNTYFRAAIKILENEVGPVYIFTEDMLYLGDVMVLY